MVQFFPNSWVSTVLTFNIWEDIKRGLHFNNKNIRGQGKHRYDNLSKIRLLFLLYKNERISVFSYNFDGLLSNSIPEDCSDLKSNINLDLLLMLVF